MALSVLVVALFSGLLLFDLAMLSALLYLGLRWASASNVTAWRMATAVVGMHVLSVSLALVAMRLLPDQPAILMGIVTLFAILPGMALVQMLTVKCVFRTTFARAAQTWLPMLLAPLVTMAFVWLVFEPYVLEAYRGPTNSMAPSLLGPHRLATCARCGAPAYGSPPHDRDRADEPWPMICRDHFHVTENSPVERSIQEADRFLALKFLRPRRWDIVVFRVPERPNEIYAKRLVGLPGEEITIVDGQLLVNGVVTRPPESLAGLEYHPAIIPSRAPVWGDADRPARLGDDEYFMLGDFSIVSADSRYWQRGAPGHAPFAVPESHLCGVATHIYWPPSRVRAFR